ncbi:hypothetical protein VP01_4100g1 [Puccinia sorghi]|uniref:Uncharacterized protein n=1 Tax=Puccinia sorghi TaxID=27349 RepID=A0A0L6URA9_9BASI|nr:hypothetical protein VP01_4100g1 [Puccinia sorghi]
MRCELRLPSCGGLSRLRIGGKKEDWQMTAIQRQETNQQSDLRSEGKERCYFNLLMRQQCEWPRDESLLNENEQIGFQIELRVTVLQAHWSAAACFQASFSIISTTGENINGATMACLNIKSMAHSEQLIFSKSPFLLPGKPGLDGLCCIGLGQRPQCGHIKDGVHYVAILRMVSIMFFNVAILKMGGVFNVAILRRVYLIWPYQVGSPECGNINYGLLNIDSVHNVAILRKNSSIFFSSFQASVKHMQTLFFWFYFGFFFLFNHGRQPQAMISLKAKWKKSSGRCGPSYTCRATLSQKSDHLNGQAIFKLEGKVYENQGTIPGISRESDISLHAFLNSCTILIIFKLKNYGKWKFRSKNSTKKVAIKIFPQNNFWFIIHKILIFPDTLAPTFPPQETSKYHFFSQIMNNPMIECLVVSVNFFPKGIELKKDNWSQEEYFFKKIFIRAKKIDSKLILS